jgi:hypothetical protein
MCDLQERLSYPIDDAFKLLGSNWNSEVLLEFSRGSRYSELQRHRNNNAMSYEFSDKGRKLFGLVNSSAAFPLRWHRGTER